MPRAPRTEDRAERSNGSEKRTSEEASDAVARAARTERVPLGVPRTKLSAPKRHGYQRRWVNDDGKGRLQNAKAGGYTFVEDPDLRVGEDDGASKSDSRVSRIVGRRDDGKPLRAFLMEIPSELFKQDQASKQAALDEMDRAIRKGRVRSDGEEHRYVPEQGRAIKIDRELKKGQAEAAEDADS